MPADQGLIVTQGILWFETLHTQVPQQLLNSKPAMFFCQTEQKDKYLTVEANTLKYMHGVRRSQCCIEIMTCRHRADIYEAKVFMTFGPRCAQTTTTSTNTRHSLVHNRTKLKNSGLSQPLFALFDPYIIYIIYNWIKNLFVVINYG